MLNVVFKSEYTLIFQTKSHMERSYRGMSYLWRISPHTENTWLFWSCSHDAKKKNKFNCHGCNIKFFLVWWCNIYWTFSKRGELKSCLTWADAMYIEITISLSSCKISCFNMFFNLILSCHRDTFAAIFAVDTNTKTLPIQDEWYKFVQHFLFPAPVL